MLKRLFMHARNVIHGIFVAASANICLRWDMAEDVTSDSRYSGS